MGSEEGMAEVGIVRLSCGGGDILDFGRSEEEGRGGNGLVWYSDGAVGGLLGGGCRLLAGDYWLLVAESR